MKLDARKLASLKIQYRKAVRSKLPAFLYYGQMINTDYAKHVIEYNENLLNLKKQ